MDKDSRPLYSQSAGLVSMTPAWNLFSRGSEIEKVEYIAKKCNGYEWRVVSVYDAHLKRTVQAYEHVSGEPSAAAPNGPNTWGSGDPHLADQAFERALQRLDEDEPCFVQVTAEGLPPSIKSKRKRAIACDGAHHNAVKPLEENIYKCEECHEGYPAASYLAHVNFDGSFSQNEDPFLSQLLEQQGIAVFSNKFKHTRLVCVQCFAKLHKPEKRCQHKP